MKSPTLWSNTVIQMSRDHALWTGPPTSTTRYAHAYLEDISTSGMYISHELARLNSLYSIKASKANSDQVRIS